MSINISQNTIPPSVITSVQTYISTHRTRKHRNLLWEIWFQSYTISDQKVQFFRGPTGILRWCAKGSLPCIWWREQEAVYYPDNLFVTSIIFNTSKESGRGIWVPKSVRWTRIALWRMWFCRTCNRIENWLTVPMIFLFALSSLKLLYYY